ncbi:MAG: VTT domain-containing protein [Planctomycetes bacterium]|nr:VTT domain-containing protein [Planctomycetota bacterium]
MTVNSGSRSSWRLVNLVAAATIVICLIILTRILPVERAIGALQSGIDRLGWLGPLAFGGAYILAGLLFVPGSALTLSSGALFGLLWGTVIVSISSTTTAALAFLIARHFARAGVQRAAKGNARFSAIDRAIGTGGWKIVALLRLSPAVPFSLGNYLYGISSIRFWPYVLASWICMLPGTFMYVYLGHAGAQGLQAVSGGGSAVGTGKTILLIAGLLATVVVTVYVTRLAQRALAEQGALDVALPPPGSDSSHLDAEAAPPGKRKTAVPIFALVLAVLTGAAWMRRDALQGIFGPPVVKLVEAYGEGGVGASFDHSIFNQLLSSHVTEGGWVDYAGLRRDSSQLDAYIALVAKARFDELSRDEKLALLINAYNAFTLRLILDKYPVTSIKDIPDADRWNDKRWNLGGNVWSLDQIEQEQIRPKFKEPRTHFALVCAAVGCPPLRNEAYVGKRIDRQLDEQARYVHSHRTWFQFKLDIKTAYLTQLYKWYGGDFEQVSGDVLKFAASFSDSLRAVLKDGKPIRIEWLDYDWRLNSVENRQDR